MAEATATSSMIELCKSDYQGSGAIPWADLFKLFLSLLGGCGLSTKRVLAIMRHPILTGHAGDLQDAIASFPACKDVEYEVFMAVCRTGRRVEESTVAKALAEANTT